MKKKIWIPLVIVAVLIIFAFIFFQEKEIDNIYIKVKSGEVSVLRDDKWITLSNEETNFENIDAIKTEEGEATLIIKQSLITTIKPNTQININKISDNQIELEQQSGTTWNKLIQSKLIIETKFTSFSTTKSSTLIEINQTAEKFTIVEGNISFQNVQESIVPIEKIIFYNENEQTISQINDAEKNIMLSFVQEDLNNLKIIRERYFDANQNTISTIQKLTGTSDEDLELTLQDIDEGKVDDRKKIEESPISLPKTIYDVLNVNDAIKEQKTLIQSLE